MPTTTPTAPTSTAPRPDPDSGRAGVNDALADALADEFDERSDPLGDLSVARRRILGIDTEGRVAQRLSQLRYTVADTLGGIRHRGGLAASVTLTVALCAAMTGASLLARTGIDDTLGRWADDVEFVVYLEPAAPQAEIDRITAQMRDHDDVRDVEVVTQQQAYDEFAELHSNRPQMMDAVTPDILPASLRVAPTEADTELIAKLTAPLGADPSVYDVVTADDAVEDMRTLSNTVSGVGTALAATLAVIAVVLSVAMLRASIAARRDEIAIKRLIGATRTYIAAPVIAEGAACAAVAAAAAASALWVGARWISGADDGVLSALAPPAGSVAPTIAAVAAGTVAAVTVTAAATVTATLARTR